MLTKRRLFILSACLLLVLLSWAYFEAGSNVPTVEKEKYDFEWILKPDNYYVTDYADGRIWVQRQKGIWWTLYDGDGDVKKLIFHALRVFPYVDGYAVFWQHDDEWRVFQGFIDIFGNVEIQPEQYTPYPSIAAQILFNTPKLRKFFPDDIDDPMTFYSDGLIRRQSTGRLYGFVDRDGKWQVPPDNQSVSRFSEGLCVAKRGGRFGYIDKKGKVIMDFRFEAAYPFYGGAALVKAGGRYGLIDKTGEYILEPSYTDAATGDGDLIAVEKENKVGFIDRSGELIIDLKYKYAKEVFANSGSTSSFYKFDKGRALVLLDNAGKNAAAVIDETGSVLYSLKDNGFTTPDTGHFNGDFLPVYYKYGYYILDRDGDLYKLPFEVPRDIVIKSFDDNLFHIAPKRKTRNYDEIVKNIMQARRDPFSHYNAKDYVIDDYGTEKSGFFKLTPKSEGFTSR